MTTVKITLQFDERDLGDKWLNPDNLEQLLYTSNHTNKELLQVIDYQEGEKKIPNETGETDKNNIKPICRYGKPIEI